MAGQALSNMFLYYSLILRIYDDKPLTKKDIQRDVHNVVYTKSLQTT